MNITLHKVVEKEKSTLQNLYSLYLHDLSKFTPNIELGSDGIFHFEDLSLFWKTEGLSPYFIHYDKSIVGFLLLVERPYLKKDHDFGINDIFVINKYKGRGIGRAALKEIFQQKEGSYFVLELAENTPAIVFWKKVYKEMDIEFEERSVRMDDDLCLIQTFRI
ncbi:GNAT family N-acetyltransferase [Sutcliffiella deserti]|uniref:GNAT family N-acetyltransferase n=1 Tax=Sutcliffiella deserti TaxID=2875501 RepID=UPI001CBCB9D0|nr:GNAT family N-acetyltransferase [Sutcliffiella deserti]